MFLLFSIAETTSSDIIRVLKKDKREINGDNMTTNIPRSFRDEGARERGNAQGGCVEATPNFREILGGQEDVGVIKLNLKYKNHKSHAKSHSLVVLTNVNPITSFMIESSGNAIILKTLKS